VSISYQKHKSLFLSDLLSTGQHMLGVSFIASMQSNLHAGVTTESTTQKVTVLSHTQKRTTALQPGVFLSGIHRVLLKNKVRSAFASANNCQSQIRTPQSVTTMCINSQTQHKYLHIRRNHKPKRVALLVLYMCNHLCFLLLFIHILVTFYKHNGMVKINVLSQYQCK
jgi:hypothetical protein